MEPGEAILAPLRFAEHKAFLQLVHSAPDGGDALYLGATLPGAIERYVTCWLPLIGLTARSRDPLLRDDEIDPCACTTAACSLPPIE